MANLNLQKQRKSAGDKWLFIFALAVLAGAIFGFLGKKAGQATPGIVFTHWWQNDLEKDTLNVLIKEFESLHGKTKITLNEMSYEDLRSVLFGETPVSPGDILALDPLWVPELFKREVIEGGWIENTPPLLSFINVLFYNVEILREAGFIRPPKTRNEFLNCARAVSGGEEIRWGLVLSGNSSRGIYDDVYPWIWAAGAQLIRDGEPAVTSRPVVESLSFLASLNSEGLIAPGAFSAAAGRKLEDFVSGRAAFMIAPVRDIAFVRERMEDSAFDISSVPMLDNYTEISFYGTAGWTTGIYSGSVHKEEARLFAAFLAEKAAFLSDKAKAVPGAGSQPDPAPFYSKAWDIAIAGESAQDFSGLAGEHELEMIFRKELSLLFEGKSTPAEAAGAIQGGWEQIIRR